MSSEPIYIEHLLSSISKKEKLSAYFKCFVLPKFLAKKVIFTNYTETMDDLATIMFTSGSTGEPKGVMLTHANITSNLQGLYQTFHINKKDTIMGVLPFFHSFGFTATLWFPLIAGMKAVYHYNPLDSKTVGSLVAKHKASILMSTPTFLNAYIKRCTIEQFAHLRLVVVGAEKLKDSIFYDFKDKFGLEPMEGYGCTELSPIVSMNLPDYREGGIHQRKFKKGKIGLPLPGVAIKILDQETNQPVQGDNQGLLFIKGPNVMKGYLNKQDLTNEVILDGWYKTGDIAKVDEDGFLQITDRLSRFSKIAGEMVPHIKVEEAILASLGINDGCVVCSVGDPKKGEALAVLYECDIDVDELVKKLKESGLPNLWIPDADHFIKVDAIPLLGTGKKDLSTINKLAKEKFGD